MRNPPELADEHRMYWAAFVDLCSCRAIAGGPIPWTAIDQYARSYGMEVDTLKYLVWALDDILRKHFKDKGND